MSEDVSKLAMRSEQTKNLKMTEWVEQSYQNYHRISTMTNARPIEVMHGTGKGPCFVLGSGPSLDYAFDGLKKHGYPIFAGGTHMAALRVHGIDPKFLVLYDSHPHNWRYIRPDKNNYDTIMITHPSCPPRILEQWQGEVLFHRIGVVYHRSHIEAATMTVGEFLEKHQPDPNNPMSFYFRDEHTMFFKSIIARAYPQFKVAFLSTSCTPNFACIVADFLGYDPIYLVGVDNGYTYGKQRAQRYLWSGVENRFTPRETPGVPAGAILSDNGMPTDEQLIAYKIALVHMSRNFSAQVYEVNDPKHPGINDFFPRVSWEGVGRVKLPIWDKKKKAEMVARWLEEHTPKKKDAPVASTEP